MSADAFHLLWAGLSIGLLVLLVSALHVHPFLALLASAVVLGLGGGLPFPKVMGEFQAGFGDVLGHVGPVIGLGTMLGTLLVRSGGADRLARAFAGGRGGGGWLGVKLFLASLLIGLPLFFEVGFVLLVPMAFALARELKTSIVRIGLPMLAGLSVAHALVPPHPAPTLAVTSLGADAGRTILYALVLGLPLGLLAGPAFAAVAARWVRSGGDGNVPKRGPTADDPAPAPPPPSLVATLFCILLPVGLMMARSLVELLAPAGSTLRAAGAAVGDPVAALFAAVVAGIFLLGRRRGESGAALASALGEGLAPVAAILLIVGAGGGFKQLLLATGVAKTLGTWAADAHVSPLVLGWGIAALVRVATGSATVATVTAVGILAPIVTAAGGPPVSRELLVLAIGSGSVILSHVNDAGFWLVKEYFGLSVADTFKTWTLMETLIAVGGLALSLLAATVVG